MATRKPFPNKYALPGCIDCGARVEPMTGVCVDNVNGKWIGKHNECPSPLVTKVVAKTANPLFPPTSEQQDCIDLFGTKQSMVIKAGAGTGKTATLRFIANYADELGLTGLYVAFNKKIVVDTAGTMPKNVKCSTVHSLAYQSVVSGTPFQLRLKESTRIKAVETARRLRTQAIKAAEYDIDRVRVAQLVMLTISEYCKTADVEINATHVPYIEGIDEPVGGKRTYKNNNKLAKKLAPIAARAWTDIINPDGVLPFKPDHYLKIWQLSHPTLAGDFILFDESQDANPVMSAVIEEQTQMQRVYVGDSNQAIYEFTGAVDAIAKQEALGLPVRMLTQSFRFGPAVAEAANVILGQLNSDLRLVGYDKIESTTGPADAFDAVLTRTNAAGIDCLMVAQEDGVRAHLIGGDDEMLKLVKAAQMLQDGKRPTHPELIGFDSWDEVLRYVKDDEGVDLRMLVNLIEKYGCSAIVTALDNQVPEKDADLIISTAHKSKGREWNRVRIASDFVKEPKKGETAAPPSDGELRLRYVAVTRAKIHLDHSVLLEEGAVA